MEKPSYDIEIGETGYLITKRIRAGGKIEYLKNYFTSWADAAAWLKLEMGQVR